MDRPSAEGLLLQYDAQHRSYICDGGNDPDYHALRARVLDAIAPPLRHPVHGAHSVDAGCGLPQTERRGAWMQTFTGRQYWPLDPRPEDVSATDIAHHLSMICRYCGACLRFYSVAEHSVGVLHVVTEHLKRVHMPLKFGLVTRRYAALHDAPEAYCHDLIRPIKRSINGYDEIEALNAVAIGAAFDFPAPDPVTIEIVKAADNAMLLAEQAQLMVPAPAKWAEMDVPNAMISDANTFLARNGRLGWAPDQAETAYLRALESLELFAP